MTLRDSGHLFRTESALYKALAHPVRLRLLDLLAREEACVCHLTAVLGLRQPYVSQQLAALRDAGLVLDRRDGNLVYYRVRDHRLVALMSLGRDVAVTGPKDGAAAASTAPAPALETCPCPRCSACRASDPADPTRTAYDAEIRAG